MIRHWTLIGLCWLVLAGVACAQAPATYGFSGDGCGGWNEYLPNQCGPGGCPVPIFRGGGQIQYQPYQGGGGVQMRPRGEPFRFPAMCEVEGGMGCHIGNQLVLTCTHGTKGTVTYQGQRYSAQVIVESPTQGGCDATILKCDAPFAQAIDLLPATPPTGTEVAWQGGTARIIRVDANSMWVAGRFRLGDSGGPIWTREGIVGVVSAVRTDGANESIGANAEACTRLLVQARLRLGISSSSGPAAINPGGAVPPPAQGAGSQCPPCAGLSAVEKRVETLEEFRDRMVRESEGKTLVAVEWVGKVNAYMEANNKTVGLLLQSDEKQLELNRNFQDRLKSLEDLDNLAAEVAKRLPPCPCPPSFELPTEQPDQPTEPKPGERRILYFTENGNPAVQSTDAKARSLKALGVPITIITLKPEETTVHDVPRIFVLPEEREIRGASSVMIYLSSIVVP